MPNYEVTFIVRQDFSEADAKKLASEMEDIATGEGGKIIKNEYWGLLDLAYEIRKNRKGHYFMLVIEAQSAAIDELSRKLKLHEDVLRNITFSVDNPDKSPSFMLKKNNYKEDAA